MMVSPIDGSGLAAELVAKAERRGVPAVSHDLAAFSPGRFLDNRGRVALLLATHGVGNPTKSAQAFDAWLTGLPDKAAELVDLRFTVFGLGNTSYGKTFNQMGRSAWARLVELCGDGAVLHEYHEGDANIDAAAGSGTDEAFDSWSDGLLDSLGAEPVDVATGGSASPTQRPVLPWVLRVLPSATPAHCVAAARAQQAARLAEGGAAAGGTAAFWPASQRPGGTFAATVIENTELRRDTSDGLSTRLLGLEFDAALGPATAFEAADTLEVLPENRAGEVGRVCALLGFDPDELFDLEPREGATTAAANPPPPFPTPCGAPPRDGDPRNCPWAQAVHIYCCKSRWEIFLMEDRVLVVFIY
jgi:sulfite reductase alpha subunit-like flavoprotein